MLEAMPRGYPSPMAKPFVIRTPTSPGVGRDPITGQMVSLGMLPSPSAPPKQAPPGVVRESSEKGEQVQDVIKASRGAYAGGSNTPYPPLPKPSLPFRV